MQLHVLESYSIYMSGRWVYNSMLCNVNLSYIWVLHLHCASLKVTSPVSSEVLKIKVRIGAISIANCFRIIGLMLSGPPALYVVLSFVVT